MYTHVYKRRSLVLLSRQKAGCFSGMAALSNPLNKLTLVDVAAFKVNLFSSAHGFKLVDVDVVQRSRHLSSLKENEVGALVANLQQPQEQNHDSHLHCLESLSNLVNLTRLPGTDSASPADKLRQSSLEARSCCLSQAPTPVCPAIFQV